MTLAGRTAQSMIAALLALAVSLALLPLGVSALDHHPQLHGIGAERLHHSPAHLGSDMGDMADAQFPCEHCGIDCCMMTHCHPGLSIEPFGILFTVPGGKTTDTIGAHAFGGPPDVAVPPPRILLV
ncbi:hypothetical protein GCM10011499_24850 [Pelagibacterium lentulum]|uniref:DUF2946 domain-containing protein n=2 Tax=Pelagibacterium lentulum TaxID=2029865 RepID=A0A916RF28_9HYPH|nr:hypothetical protein GCM10011499_24850 [Pelagibacterium lentulum]